MSKIAISSTYPATEFQSLYEEFQGALKEDQILLSYEPVTTARALPEVAIKIAGVVGEKVLGKLIEYLYEKFVKPKEQEKPQSVSYYVTHIDVNVSYKLPEEQDKCLRHFAEYSLPQYTPTDILKSAEWKMAELSMSSRGDAQSSLIAGLHGLLAKQNLNALKALLWIVGSKLGNPRLSDGQLSAEGYEDLLKHCSQDYVSLFYAYTFCPVFETEVKGLRFDSEAKAFIKLFRQIPTQRVLGQPDAVHSELIKPFLSAATVYVAAKNKSVGVADETNINRFLYATLGHIASRAKVIHGDNATADLELGAGLCLRCNDMRDVFDRIILHELGHHFFQGISGIPY